MYYFLRSCGFAVLIFGFSSFAKEDTPWREYFQNDQVKIEVSANPCSNDQAGISKNYLFIRISNKTSDQLEVSFTRELWYDGICSNCTGGGEAKSNLVLKGGETVEGNCGSTKELKVLESMENGSKRKLTKFEFKNVTVKTLN